jgi:hypothetical protein
MADSPPFEVRLPDGEYQRVLLVPGTPASDVKEAVAGAVRLPVGTFTLKNEDGATTVFHDGLTGRWTVVLLPAAGKTGGVGH